MGTARNSSCQCLFANVATMTTQPPKKLHSIAVRLDDRTLEELRAAALRESRTISNLTAVIIRKWLDANPAPSEG